MWIAPTPDERQQLLGEHRHRHPAPTRIQVMDGAARISLSFLLGNPTGSLRPPPPAASPAFGQIIGAVTLGRTDDGDDDALVRDCVLWPAAGLVTQARERWPGIAQELSRSIARKIGLTTPPTELLPGDMPPALDELARNPRVALRRFSPPDERGRPVPVTLAIATPDRLRYDAFSDTIGRCPEVERARLVREFADGLIVGSDGPPAAEVCDRWPGVMLLAVGVALRIAGAASQAHLGEW